MKKINFFCRLAAVSTALILLSSCRSIDTADIPVPASAASSSRTEAAAETAAGIILGGAGVTAVTAAPFPGNDISPADVTSVVTSDADTTSGASATTADASAVSTTAAADDTAAETTTAAASSVTAAVSTTTDTTTTTATSTTTTTTTTTTAAAVTEAPPIQSGSYAKNSYKALNHSYVKAVWISYIELSNHLAGKNEAGFRSEFGAMLDNCVGLGINTVYVHVRSHGDAYYYSSLFPFTKRLGGTLGTRASFDPLSIMVSEAHARNISIHAWINPLRLGSDSDLAASAGYPVGKWYSGAEKGTYIVNVSGTWYLNPGYTAVRSLIADNVREIVSDYDVDGVHIDDYFYPSTDAGFDSAAFSASGYSTLSSFRIGNINAMVRDMYTAAHECGSAVFGAAPQGNNSNNLNQLYADTKAWCAGGYIDYFAPQIYYGFKNSGVPFAGCVDEWAAIVKGTKTKLYAGLSVYKAGNEDKWAGTGKTEWQDNTDILARQKEYADSSGCNGIALYSYSYLFDSGYRTSAMKAEIDNLKPLMTK